MVFAPFCGGGTKRFDFGHGDTLTTLGRCKLCALDKNLQDSHFIGRAVYKKLNEPLIKNPQPIVITSKVLKQSPVQLRDDVFCSDC
jgi:hypothetical protein